MRAGDEGSTLYRAVGRDELSDIQNVGHYRVAPGGTEGKYFFDTPEQASNFAKTMNERFPRVSPGELRKPGNSYTTTSVGQAIHPAREGPGVFFETPDVPFGSVNVFNHSVFP